MNFYDDLVMQTQMNYSRHYPIYASGSTPYQLTDKKPLPYSEQIHRLVQEVKEADCVVVGGASGLSAAGGGDFYYEDNDSYRKYFRPFAEKYHFKGAFAGMMHPWKTREEYWGYLATFLHTTQTDLVGKEASFDADLGYLVQDEELLDINMVVNHFGEETRSRIKADGALKDKAKKVFRGTIDFKKGSVGAEGEETETVLMLGDDVQNQTIPVILCSEETVAGSHGATIGELDEDTLFYFESRGIGKKEAEDIMARAAIDRIGRLLCEEKAQEWIQDGLKEVLS